MHNENIEDDFELLAVEGELTLEALPEGDALACFASATSASSASCPASSASSFTTASSYSG